MKTCYFFIIALFAITTSISGAEANDQYNATSAFERIKSFVGDWKRKDAPDSKLTIRFQLTANGTTVLETWIYESKPHSLTVYHRDGDNLLATHYCPQGNQPRLKMVTSMKHGEIKFDYMDATNLKSLDQSHQHGLSFMLTDQNHTLLRGETYLSNEGPDISGLVLERVQP